MAFEELKALHAEMWGAALWERFGGPSMTDIHDDLVRRLGVQGG
jgi:hypothetical protein